MPIISRQELEQINVIFGDIAREVMEIQKKAPQCSDECDAIRKAGRGAFRLLSEVQARSAKHKRKTDH